MLRIRWAGIALLAACNGQSGTGEPPGTEPQDTDVPPVVVEDATWDDVAPILEARCARCHQADGIGPMSLASHADAAPWAAAIVASTAARTMPPWLVTDDGTCGDYADSDWLSDLELATLAAWAENGAKAGTTGDLPPVAPPTLGDRRDLELVTPEIVPESEGSPFAPNDEYRCVAFPNEAGRDWFLTGYEVVPGNTTIVHHVLAMIVDPAATGWGQGTNGEEIAAMEADDARPGWDCLGTVGGYARERAIPGTWAPGQGAVTFPDGLGVRVRSTDWVVVQIHYSLAEPGAAGQSDSSKVYLRTEDEVPTEAYVSLPDGFIDSLYSFPPDTIPAGEAAYEYTWSVDGRGLLDRAYVEDPTVQSFRIRSVMPHMHKRGTKQTMHVDRGGGAPDCAMDVPRWDFDWQRIYAYETPIEVAADDVVSVTCTYDTTADDRSITPGWGTQNEMCLVVMMLTLD